MHFPARRRGWPQYLHGRAHRGGRPRWLDKSTVVFAADISRCRGRPWAPVSRWHLEPGFPGSMRFEPVGSSHFGAHGYQLDARPHPVQDPPRGELLEHDCMKLFPNSGFRPMAQTSPSRAPGPATERPGQVTPPAPKCAVRGERPPTRTCHQSEAAHLAPVW